jgi:hypothetical protein
MSKLKRNRNREKLAQKMLTRQNVNTVRDTYATRVINAERARRERIQQNMIGNAIQRKMEGQLPEDPIPINRLLWNPDYVKYDPRQVHIDAVLLNEGGYAGVVLALHPEQGMVEIYRHSEKFPDRLGATLDLAKHLPLVPILGDTIEYPYYDEGKGKRMEEARKRRRIRATKQGLMAHGAKIKDATDDEILAFSLRQSDGSAATVDPVRERTEHQRVRGETSQAEVSDNG